MQQYWQDTPIPSAYFTGYVFWAMWLDVAFSLRLGYLYLLFVTVILALKARNYFPLTTLLFGNLVSLVTSFLILTVLQKPHWNAHFSPLGLPGTAALLQFYCLMLQYVICQWDQERTRLHNILFFTALGILSISFVLYLFS